jgi:hypothetical protein
LSALRRRIELVFTAHLPLCETFGLAALADGRLQATPAELEASLRGRVTEEELAREAVVQQMMN